MEFHEFFTPPVVWFVIGLFLIILEIALPGLILIFFGVGAWVTSLSILLFNPGLNMQLLIFVISSVAGLFLLRKFIKHRFFEEQEDDVDILEDEFIGKTLFVASDFKKGVPGKVHFKGTQWTAIADTELKHGDEVKIIEKDSIKLHISKIIVKKA